MLCSVLRIQLKSGANCKNISPTGGVSTSMGFSIGGGTLRRDEGGLPVTGDVCLSCARRCHFVYYGLKYGVLRALADPS